MPVPNTPILIPTPPLPTFHLRLAGASRARGQAARMKIARFTLPVMLTAAVAATPAEHGGCDDD
jgi:hypothetical protein